MKSNRYLFAILLTIFFLRLSGQNAPVTILPDVTCNPGETIDVPVTVKNFNNIGSLSLTLHYDPAVLTYQSFTNNSGFPSLAINGTTPGEVIAGGLVFPWDPGVSLPDDATLFTLTFQCNGGATGLVWYDNGTTCEYSDIQYFPLTDIPACVYYKNGTVNSNRIELNLRVYLEGAYSAGSMSTLLATSGLIPLTQPFGSSPWNYNGFESVLTVPANVVDWVLVELRETPGDASTATQDKTIARQAGFLLSDGTIKNAGLCGNMEFYHTPTGNLYIVVYHRNHIPVISANPLSVINGIAAYNFSAGEFQAFGGASGHKYLGDGVWGMMAGDANGDGEINLLDKTTGIELNAGLYGYKNSDFTLDSQVNNIDKNDFWYINLGSSSQIPQ